MIISSISKFLSQFTSNSSKRSTVGGWKKETYSKLVSKLVRERYCEPGISEHAIICDSAKVSASASISAGAYIGNNVQIGEKTRIYPSATILDDTIIGNNVIVGAGTVIGGEGFGYYQEKKTGEIKHVPHLGKVIIEDDVHIGSNVSIDRASTEKTLIKKGAKINNNVHIAHNVIVGQFSLIMAGVSVSGSTVIGEKAVINPQAAISKHVKVGDGAEVGMNSTVVRDVAPNTRVLGSPAKEK